MGLSRETRIITLLVIDTVFFFIELFFGYAVGSIALIADSFHMLNDVISLVVALYAIRLATASSTAKYSYGWQRAEILGALINGVFLLALCFSIFLECIQRFFTVPEVTNPMIVVIVGSFGLASNVVGLFLFHDHGHSHGGGGHSHGPSKPVKKHSAIEGASDSDPLLPTASHSHRTRKDSLSSLYGHPAQTRASVVAAAEQMGYGHAHAHDHQHVERPGSPGAASGRSRSRGWAETTEDAAAKARAKLESLVESSPPGSEHGAHDHDHDHANHTHSHSESTTSYADAVKTPRSYGATDSTVVAPHSHDDHSHAHGEEGHSHSHDEGGADDHSGHSHGNMNMKGVFLHVLGDALGNVGVIASGLVIWFCKGHWRFYSDPLISFFITVIIFSSALPLVKSASFILLQAVPSTVSLDDLRESIKDVPGVFSVHELHCWQLSESKIVASVHVLVKPGSEYMSTVQGIRKVLHDYGIHSSTIQPEYSHPDDVSSDSAEEENCLIQCPPDSTCAPEQCCPPGVTAAPIISGEDSV
ncbi:cation efflux protein [Mrakia frigida]|uniref:cation diffusion facilitator family transporter n=1 Tax=Mrakia frigida TaxID=29902 RepID=UPI003FCC0587